MSGGISNTFRLAAMMGAVAAVLCQPLFASAEENSPLGQARILASCAADMIAAMSPEMDWVGFEERNLVIVTFKGDKASMQNADGTLTLISDAAMTRYANALTCDQGDEFLLIGKDRGPKRRWVGTVSIQELFQTIDAMPMRQYEMRKTQSRFLKLNKE